MEKSVKHTIYSLDVVEGYTTANVDRLSKVVLQNSSNRLGGDPTHTDYEDCYCPPSAILDKIVEDMQEASKILQYRPYKQPARSLGKLEVLKYWGHVHEKNMSTNKHNHKPSDLAAVVYLSVPEKAGQIVFWPIEDYRYTIQPKKGMFILFPGWIPHSVTRNLSDEPRVSVSLNFNVNPEGA